ncbi:MAG: septum formation initiator family protein [Verrucomicrobia bacterium]|nr:septum formation initiator family protein [Verrucomicrobiota bacterium]
MSAILRVNESGEGLWGLANRLLMGLIVLALLAGAGLSYLPLIQQNRDLRERLERNRAELATLQAELRYLQSTVNALKTDPRAVERAARERGMAKPGETIIRFESAPR